LKIIHNATTSRITGQPFSFLHPISVYEQIALTVCDGD